MADSSTILQGLEPSWTSLLLFPLSILTLLFSMVIADRWVGGIDFGPILWILPRAVALCALVTAVNFLSWGVILSAPVWYFGLMGLFHLSFREAAVLTNINWPVMVVWKVLLAILIIE
ncbi:MAG: hypothetical protein NZM31_12875 [Gemmatales bacterium]|nr:hypothetical protein [Gemmatales bacterium]MDW8387889.1 hypothetical protein [Gemmatales bacterium]